MIGIFSYDYERIYMDIFMHIGKRLPPITMNDVPNIPGMRRDLSTTHPILYKQFKASQPQLAENFSSGDSLYQMDKNDGDRIPTVECDFSFTGIYLLLVM